MNRLDEILTANNGGGVTQLANQFGLTEAQTTAAIQNLLPGIATGIQHNLDEGGLPSLLSALNGRKHDKYLDSPVTLSSTGAVEEGNGILGHILGNKDVSRHVASRAASRTGINEGILKQMLPMIAAMAMGALSKRTGGSAAPSGSAQAGSDIAGMLGSLLDRDRDGSIVDDVLGSLLRKR